jgi:HEAT repeat protein
MSFRRLRLRLQTQLVLIALLAVALWAGLSIRSPTRRLGRLLRADQPAFIRLEAAAELGYKAPAWEVEQAVSILIGVCDDPSPRVRESALAGLYHLGPKAERAVPKAASLLKDDDRYVRYSSAKALGWIVRPNSPRRAEATAALVPALDDLDPDARLAAAEALWKIGEGASAVATLSAALRASDELLCDRARHIISFLGTGARAFIPALAADLTSRDERRREQALTSLLKIAGPRDVGPALRLAAASGEPEVCRWAQKQLERLQMVPGAETRP